jgi:HAD superfamily hydrolase (TIGR01662 family)
MPVIHGVIFDLGATLIYTELEGEFAQLFPRMDAALWAYLQSQGYGPDSDVFLRYFAGNFKVGDRLRQERPVADVLKRTLAELGAPPPSPAVVAEALRAYFAYSESLWRPVPGVHDTLEQLMAAGRRLAIISNANDEANVQRLIDGANLRRYFDPIIISAVAGIRKPDPAIFDLVLQPWELSAAQCVMVGDTLDADILGAQRAGLHTVWITAHADLPAANRARLGEIIPDVEIASLAQLPGVLEHWSAPGTPSPSRRK